jgi:hypothetical protein
MFYQNFIIKLNKNNTKQIYYIHIYIYKLIINEEIDNNKLINN